MKSYEQIVSHLNQKPMIPTYIPSLDRISAAIQAFFPDLAVYKQQMIVIAGTNGKGSTAKALESLLLTSGKQVCLFTSPHLITINERMRCDGQMISDQDFAIHYQNIEAYIVTYELSHFEILTLLALSYFKTAILSGSYCIWEVGMGGRWDATNAIPHAFNVLTTIGIDHQKYLGTSVDEIASNKFDIIQLDSVTLSGFLPGSTFLLLKNKVDGQNSKWLDLAKDVTFQTTFSYDREDGLKDFILYQGEKYSLGLSGERGYQNILLALYTLQALGIEIQKKHLASLSRIRWPHRFSLLTNAVAPCPVYLSGDHNPEGIGSLLTIVERLKYQTLWLLVALTEGRDPEVMLEPLARISHSKMILTESPFKPLKIEDYQSMWKGFTTYQPKCFKDVEEAFQSISHEASVDDIIVVTGSLYLTGKIDEIFGISDAAML
jgi:dihydrofolate synthase/folylpolyglutamate synthase